MFKHLVMAFSRMRFSPFLLTGLLMLVTILSCSDDEVNIPDGAFDEHIVDLQGTWTISRVLQNDRDITAGLDFSNLSLTLLMDGTGPTNFEIDNQGIPFAVLNSGTWAYNDAIYPTAILFTTGTETRSVEFLEPPVSTSNRMSLTFSLGCQDNSYVYEFRKN